MDELDDWNRRTAALLEEAYLAAGAGPGGSGSSDRSADAWRAKRQHLAHPMDRDGPWLDVGCANGYLLVTLPEWAKERGMTVQPHGLELLPRLAAHARSLHTQLADSIGTGDVMSWAPPRQLRHVTAFEDAVPPHRLGALVSRLLAGLVSPGGRLILSSYTDRGARPRALFDDLRACGHPPDGIIRIDRPGRAPLLTAWLDARDTEQR